MSDFVIAFEAPLRLGCFLAVLLAMLSWESVRPYRAPSRLLASRRLTNLSLVAIDTLLLRLLLPAAAAATAAHAADHNWGVLRLSAVPEAVTIVAGVVLLDLSVWAQHIALHKVPLLWRLHRVHHSDVAFDTTTAVRFHPAEIIISMLYKCAVVALLGVPPAGVVVFEVLLSASALFSHGNVHLSGSWDRWLQRIIVTPDMHRIHHSTLLDETNSNYGFNLAFWDRCFGTYRAQPAEGHLAMRIGLQEFRDGREQRLDQLLVQPLRSQKA